MMLKNVFAVVFLTCLLIIVNVSDELQLSSDKTWDQNGITVVGNANGSSGSSLYYLDQPAGIVIPDDDGDVLYVSDDFNNRIVAVQLEVTNDVFTIGSGNGSALTEFTRPCDVFIIDAALYINDAHNSRVKRTSLNGSNPTIVLNYTGALNSPTFLYVDKNNGIYLSNTNGHTIVYFPVNSSYSSVVAGTGMPGANTYQLCSPYGFFVTDNGTLYIADSSNHRILKWLSGASSGTVVAGNGTAGATLSQLFVPTDVIVDDNEQIYICEYGNSRITRWKPNSPFGECIAACTGTSGIAATQLYYPISLAFDRCGSIYVSDSGNNRTQKFQITPHNISFNQPKFSTCTTWKSHATTSLNQSHVGTTAYSLFIDTNNMIYVSEYARSRVQVWLEDITTPTKNISGGLSYPYSVFVADNGDVYVDNGVFNNRVDKWTINTTNGVPAMYVQGRCRGLFVDVYENIYCSMDLQHCVVKRSCNDGPNVTKMIAGNGNVGALAHMLHGPTGIFVDINTNLYVADCYNNRIQLFLSGKLNATTIAGSGAPGTISLMCPTDIKLDADGYLFIVDSQNNRIVRSRSLGFECIVGCSSGAGSTSNKLNQPMTISFDSFGNLFVADLLNNRIQKFLLTNENCFVSYNQPKFCLNATWDSNATTFLDSKIIGSEPQDIFIDTNDTAYLVSRVSGDVFITSKDGNNTLLLNISVSSKIRYSLFVANNKDVYVDNGAVDGSVDRWIFSTAKVVTSMNVTSLCYDLFIDIDDVLYCSDDNQHQVVKTLLESNSSTVTIAAGNGTQGSESNMLYFPRGIFVDMNRNLYVADCGNNRVQKYSSNQLNGITIVGTGSNHSIILSCPAGIVLDGNDYLFIVDSNNNRIIGSSSNGFRCIVGCSAVAGSAADELKSPQQISFDSYGNLFVTDSDNDRVQKFLLDPNSCDNITLSTTKQTSLYSTGLSTTAPISTSNICDMLRPCQYNGSCYAGNNTQYGYICTCLSDFNGTECQYDYRLCKPNTCWNNGVCYGTPNSTFLCSCQMGWMGIYCEEKLNYCQNVTCENNGVCRGLLLGYRCECLGHSYSGRHCEFTDGSIILYKKVAKSFAYIAIIAMSLVALFVVFMDILKYCFGIDLVDRDLPRRNKVKKRRAPVILRFIYVDSVRS
ncbi:unnamed protein product [Adineta ricciae]|uniref:EGF-like domain-containing protein n=1 Tax=Adineta ricciae TaxID=249248 RepID=A0A813WUP4_ADIRI|nr:unnamed protein product [Adineta ricciae]CAF1120657.1 unnamed protein product [Adineta ricciae]